MWSPQIADPLVHAYVGLLQPIYERFLLGAIFAASVAVIRSWSFNSSSIDIESSLLCFTTDSNHGLLSSWKTILSRKRRRIKGTLRAQGVPCKEHQYFYGIFKGNT